ncbi:uncharacterized protein [Paramormyrops kingsleyae]|uniref:uncharacterized protein n=1 Tax=Paramormyrops kingsleyae TaxID=1676925 RepID=UPI003B96B36F
MGGAASAMIPPVECETKRTESVLMERAGSPVPSCVSMNSDQSMNPPIVFREGRFPTDQRDRVNRCNSHPHKADLSSIFKLLEKKAQKFLKDELMKFKRYLDQNDPECSEPQLEEDNDLDSDGQMQKTCGREGALKITLYILRTMEQNDLADMLEKRHLLSQCQHIIKCNLKKKFECVFEGKAKEGQPTLLKEIYTELYITEGGAGGVNDEHEVRQIETASKKRVTEDTTVKLDSCRLTETCCEVLASALRSNSSQLRELDLSDNDLQDSGVKLFSAGLGDSHCTLEILRLPFCRVTEEGCSSLASALRSNPSHLRELDLSYNHPGDSGVKLLSVLLEDPSCKLEKLNVDHSEECRTRPGFQKYSCQLTLDPNTANSRLSLSEGNRKVTCGAEQPYPDHPERFDWLEQVLCRESLSGRCYWEAEWSGYEARIAVTYKGIRRKGLSDDCGLGYNDKSWSLFCSPDSYFVYHNNKLTVIPIKPSGSRRVGVYLDWAAGTLSFYRVSSDGLTLLYSFTSSFTEPLCPGFYVYYYSSVSLCMLG